MSVSSITNHKSRVARSGQVRGGEQLTTGGQTVLNDIKYDNSHTYNADADIFVVPVPVQCREQGVESATISPTRRRPSVCMGVGTYRISSVSDHPRSQTLSLERDQPVTGTGVRVGRFFRWVFGKRKVNYQYYNNISHSATSVGKRHYH